MAGAQKKSRKHHKIRDNYRKFRTRARVKDLDQIHEDLKKLTRSSNDGTPVEAEVKFNVDLPGGGLHPCVHCARHFVNQKALDAHLKTKDHKRRVKEINEEEPYTQKDAEAAVGFSTDNTRSLNDMIISA
ncbi:hypothetical protein MIR68_007611 [Amoeboaphelidium protococcarum]|nr:hypothetical protein MIR68_007611 [Amoeboaphelidium protococcarum]KAI3642627.1 hypothetical protein MP228_012182 [Amoeboaphelidium protococcarum]KAI3645527.1 hypothetical protein MP228_008455 [Amoeboaphelidium protococcarum]